MCLFQGPPVHAAADTRSAFLSRQRLARGERYGKEGAEFATFSATLFSLCLTEALIPSSSIPTNGLDKIGRLILGYRGSRPKAIVVNFEQFLVMPLSILGKRGVAELSCSTRIEEKNARTTLS